MAHSVSTTTCALKSSIFAAVARHSKSEISRRTLPVVAIAPDAGTVLDTYTCEIVEAAVDPEGAEVTYSYVWAVNGYVNGFYGFALEQL